MKWRKFLPVMTLGFALCAQTPYQWDLPRGFPRPPVPTDNPMTAEKVELGRRLFYDQRMSANGTQSCASCHIQRLAFTDGKSRSAGSTGELHPRGSMSLVNVAYAPALTWANPDLHSLEEQARTPLFGHQPIELGMDPQGEAFLAIVRADPAYQKIIGPQPVNIETLIRAIACFERSIISARSPYDRYHFDRDEMAISAEAKRGEELFFSQPFACFSCHSGPNFTGKTSDPDGYKAPTLRNIALTAPYMHDGNIATLEQAIGHQNDILSPQNRAAIAAFLRTLTDDTLIHDPRFSQP